MDWKRLKCILTGGCKYDPQELLFTYVPSDIFFNARYLISNRCVKCGKQYIGEIPAEHIDRLLLMAAKRERKRRAEDGK
jgi:hypothetical protein